MEHVDRIHNLGGPIITEGRLEATVGADPGPCPCEIQLRFVEGGPSKYLSA